MANCCDVIQSLRYQDEILFDMKRRTCREEKVTILLSQKEGKMCRREKWQCARNSGTERPEKHMLNRDFSRRSLMAGGFHDEAL